MIPVGAVIDCEVCGGSGVITATDLTSTDEPERTRAIETCPRCLGTGGRVITEIRV